MRLPSGVRPGRYVRRGVVRETARDTSTAGDNININVAFVFTTERNLRAIRRKARTELAARARGKPASFASGARNNPEVVRIFKSDLRLADRRIAEEKRAFGLAGKRKRDEGDGKQEQDGLHKSSGHYMLF